MADQWYYTQNDERQGPVTPEELKELANAGQLKPDDLIWKKGMKDWIEAARISGLIPFDLADVPPPLPKSVSTDHVAPSPVAPVPQRAADPLDFLNTASPRLATSPSRPKTSSAIRPSAGTLHAPTLHSGKGTGRSGRLSAIVANFEQRAAHPTFLRIAYQIALGCAVLSVFLPWNVDATPRFQLGMQPVQEVRGLFGVPGLLTLIVCVGGIAVAHLGPNRIFGKYAQFALVGIGILAAVTTFGGQYLLMGHRAATGVSACIIACGIASGFGLLLARNHAVLATVGAALLLFGCLTPWWTSEYRSPEQVVAEFSGLHDTNDLKVQDALKRHFDKMGDWPIDAHDIGEYSDEGQLITLHYSTGKVYGFKTWVGRCGILVAAGVLLLFSLPVSVLLAYRHLALGGVGLGLGLWLILWMTFAPSVSIKPCYVDGLSVFVLAPLLGCGMLAVSVMSDGITQPTICDKTTASSIMSGTGAQVLGGLKTAKDIVAQKATVMKLNHQLSGLKRTIGKVVHDHGIDCGECCGIAAAALADVQKANQRIEQASAAMKQSAGVKEKAVAAKDYATAKAAQKTAEMRMNAAYDALGDYVLANGVSVPSMENEIATAQSVQQKVQATNQQIGQLSSGLMKNKISLAAVAGVVLIAALGIYSMVSSVIGHRESIPGTHGSNQQRTTRSEKHSGGPDGWSDGGGWSDGPSAWDDDQAAQEYLNSAGSMRRKRGGTAVAGGGKDAPEEDVSSMNVEQLQQRFGSPAEVHIHPRHSNMKLFAWNAGPDKLAVIGVVFRIDGVPGYAVLGPAKVVPASRWERMKRALDQD